ncbi:PH domain-containing protein [Lederbergia lenta]|uniref:YdbT n=2 Tax=Lederbergia lenta TaxID=1467 RepID=A0A2X4VM61_LEDLE|nr:PH domain-containing protein [Lederbergia lenta]MEC2326509.1 PH domain-containing protein [Lederbergia lenta]SQI53246.1 YdbT [Lederbergia lenta]
MMSDPKRLHPISIIFEFLSFLKQVIFPLVLWFFVFMRNDEKTGTLWDYAPWIGIGLVILFTTVLSIIKWSRYTYRVEDMELRIEHGLFIKKKRYIPFERIQSLDFSESILHRPFGLVKVNVETAGGNDKTAEAEMTAIDKEAAFALKRVIAEAKNTGNIALDETEIETKETVLYKITQRQLMFFASTSGRAGLVISAVLAFAAQFDELIPFDKIFKEMEQVVRAGYFIVGAIVFAALLLAWILSVIMTYLKYNDFTLKHTEDDFVITRGLLEKRTTTIPIRRIQAIRMIESPLRQPFGYASVVVEYAGGSSADEKTEGLIMPVIKKQAIASHLEDALVDYSFHVDFTPPPKRAKRRFYFVNLIQAAVVAAGLTIWLWPYGAIAIILIPLAWILGVFRYQSAGWNIKGDQLALRYRVLEQQTVLLRKNRMQSMDVTVNWFQNRADLATVSTAVMSGGNAGAGVTHIDKKDAEFIYKWYIPKEQIVNNEEPKKSE